MNWRKVSLWSVGGVLALLLIATSALFLVDLGIFKPQIEQWVSDKTGRHFTIEGQFEVSLGGQSVVAAKDVRLANASWSDDAYMLELGYVEVRVNTLSLLAGRIEIDLIRLDDTSIRLERIDDITPNWELIAASPDAAKTSGDEKINWLVRQIDIERLHIVYLSPDRTGPLDLRIERLSQQHRDDDYLELTMDASIGERDVSLTAEAGTWNALLEQKNVEYELSAQLDTLHIESKGRIDDLLAPRKPVLSFSAKGPDVNDLARLLQVPERGVGDIDLSGSLAAPDNGNLVLSVDGNLGRIQAEGVGYFSDLQDLEQFDIDLDVSGPDVGHILGFMGIQQLLGVAFELNLRAERQGPMVIVRQLLLVPKLRPGCTVVRIGAQSKAAFGYGCQLLVVGLRRGDHAVVPSHPVGVQPTARVRDNIAPVDSVKPHEVPLPSIRLSFSWVQMLGTLGVLAIPFPRIQIVPM